jgi:peptidoglycan hydrolase-like amidase
METHRNKIPILVLLLTLFSIFVLYHPVKADELEDIARQIAELEKAKNQSENATKPLEEEVQTLNKKLDSIDYSISIAKKNLNDTRENINKREKEFSYQYKLLASRVEQLYKRLRGPSELFLFFSQNSASQLTRELGYRKAVTQEDKNTIINISKQLSQLEKDKQKFEKDKALFEDLEQKVAAQRSFFQKEIEGAKKYQQVLSQKITELSQKQKELLAKKTESFQISVGNVPLADDPASRPDYNPGFSPAFAAFSFGAPHFKGMSQYGAFGRAKEGQSHEEILKAYYGDVRIETVETSFDLPTTVGNLPFEDNYLKGIAEMPTQWADQGGYEALKAQAIAARSYALAYVGWRMGDRGSKKSICTTENCQVYNSSKAGNPGRWGDAVNDTKGKILVSNKSNEIVNTWYASTSGGYQESYSSLGHDTPSFWDTKSGRSGWTSQAFEKIGDSPWFYKGWYKTRSGTSCGRSHPWLNQDEMSDIVNAAIVYSHDNGSQSHLSQEDSSCYGESIPDTWSKQRLKEEAGKHGGAVTSISSVSVTYSDSGVTSQVIFNTNRGTVTISGSDFYKVFNLRTPGAIHLTSGLYNLEKK